jgi:sugar/nucleoside kinase (ribokinase family)
MPIRVAGAGCCLMDILYPKVDFRSAAFEAARSRADGDGGLVPGRLVFAEDARRFLAARPAGGLGERSFSEALAAITSGAAPTENVGGPSIVALIHAAQMLEGKDVRIEFAGARGSDELGERILGLLRKTPVGLSGYRRVEGRSPSTIVLSDPSWDGGKGERCFINEIGAAALFLPTDIGADFLGADIVAFGGTGLAPALHDGLPRLLPAARARGALTVVNTVFDFRNESRDPSGAWPLGPAPASGERGPGPRESYRNCELLIMDADEALRLAGDSSLEAACAFFVRSGVGAFVVSRGGKSIILWSGGRRFAPLALSELPVSGLALRELAAQAAGGERYGDTTGCGDAFAGGIIANLAEQLEDGRERLELAEAVGWGIAGGAATLFILGGTFYEARPGQKRETVERFHADWLCNDEPSGST